MAIATRTVRLVRNSGQISKGHATYGASLATPRMGYAKRKRKGL